MHELGIVFHIIKNVDQVIADNDLTDIKSVTVEIGEVSTVIPSYLEDCWKWAAAKHDILKDSKLIIDTILAITYCENCNKTYETVKHGKICPHCGSEATYLIQGNEFNIREIEAC